MKIFSLALPILFTVQLAFAGESLEGRYERYFRAVFELAASGETSALLVAARDLADLRNQLPVSLRGEARQSAVILYAAAARLAEDPQDIRLSRRMLQQEAQLFHAEWAAEDAAQVLPVTELLARMEKGAQLFYDVLFGLRWDLSADE